MLSQVIKFKCDNTVCMVWYEDNVTFMPSLMEQNSSKPLWKGKSNNKNLL